MGGYGNEWLNNTVQLKGSATQIFVFSEPSIEHMLDNLVWEVRWNVPIEIFHEIQLQVIGKPLDS